MSCFNKNTKLYKDLMEQTEGNESLVTAILVHYNGDLTNVFKTRTELRESLRIGSNLSDANVIQLYKRIGQYNKVNGTSHSLLKRQRGEANLYDVRLKINYLPRNFFAHIMRTAMRKDDGTWYNMDTQVSFKDEDVRAYNNVNTPAISPGERYRDPRNTRSTETESDLGYFDENGDFKPKDDYNNTDYILNTNTNSNQVNYALKAVTILQSAKGDEIFRKGDKNNWDIDKILSELNIPKEQKELIKSFNTRNREEIITNLLANYSYTVEINTAKEKTSEFVGGDDFIESLPIYDDENNIIGFEDIGGTPSEIVDFERNTEYYSNLTVPGGTNYTENEISTPLITPSIKGHAQFATDKGIGWFRSDDKISEQKKEFSDLLNKNRIEDTDKINELRKTKDLPTNIRRILEVQSDLFQKGRDKANLTNSEEIDEVIAYINNTTVVRDNKEYYADRTSRYYQISTENNQGYTNKVQVKFEDFPKDVQEEITKILDDKIKKLWESGDMGQLLPNNQFLQLLNKDNNWVTFFVKSIIQDSAKKGYEKVLFPSGDTASKVEGHTTLEEFKKQKEDRIKELEEGINDFNYELSSNYYFEKDGKYYWEDIQAGQFGEETTKEITKEVYDKGKKGELQKEATQREINQLKQELERVEGPEGFGALKPIYNFYENTVTNILKKQGLISNQITDEYGNTWNEVVVTNNSFNNIDLILPTAPDKLVRLVDKKLQLLNSKILSLREDLAKADDATKIKSLEREIAKYRNKVEEIKGNKIDISKTENYEQIVSNAEQELSKIQKLLGQSTITLADLKYASEITDFWIKVGTFTTPENHPLLDAVEFDSDVIREIFGSIRTKYERVNMDILRLEKEHLEEYAKEKGSKSTYEQLIAPMEDLSKAFVETRWSGKANDELLQILANSIEQATIKGFNESNLVWKELDRMSKNVITQAKSLGTSTDGNPFSVFKQFTKNGKETGKGVHLWTDEYFRVKSAKRKAAFFTKDKNGNVIKNKAAIDDYYKFINEDIVTMDPRMLFPDSGDIDSAFVYNRVTFSENDKKKHQEELKKHLGDYSYEKYYTRLQEKIDKFKLQREAAWDSIQEQNLEESDKKDLMEEWLRENSPYWMLDMAENPAMRMKPDGKTYYSSKGHEYTYEIPKREKNGKETGWYDKNFDKIVNNEHLLEFYEYYTDLLISLKKIFPEEKQKMLGMNVIPTLEKTLMDTFTEKGMMGSYSLFKDKIREAISVSELGTTGTDSDKQIQTKFIIDNKGRIVEALKLEILKIENLQGRKVTISERNEIQERIIDEMSKEKSWDLIKILKGYSLMALTYKQKLMIEPQVKLIEKVFQERQEIKTNRAGVPLLDKDGQVDLKTKEESLKNTKDAIEFVTNSEFYGISTRKVEGKSKKKQYTKEEEKEKTELEALKESVTDLDEKVLVQKKIDSLGYYITLSEVGDSLLKYNQLLSLGWNIPSAINNLSFGVVANFIEGSGGIHYNNTKLRKGYMLATNSIVKNATFNSWEGVNGNATKIRSLMDKMDLLKTIVNETYEPSIESTTGKLKRFGPMSMQQRTEYLNYAPVMIAIMDHEKADGTPIFSATDPEGKEVSIWEAYGIDGELKEGFTTTVDEVLLTQKIKRVIEMNHGDYTRTTKLQNKFTGRMMMQFRKWMIEGFASRFEEGGKDIGLSYGLDEPFIRKGRYRSYTQGQLGVTGATIGTLVLPGIGTAVGAGVGYLGGKLFGLQTEQNAIGDTLFTLKQLLRKLTFRSTEFDKQFNKQDAANMRKNFQELAIMTTLYLVVLGLAKGLGDDDDEKNKAFAAVMLINQGNRLITDIEFYTNPLALEKLSKSAIPMTRLVQASSNWAKAVGEQFDEDSDNDYMQSGLFEDWNKVLVRTLEATPLTTSGIKAVKFGTQIFD